MPTARQPRPCPRHIAAVLLAALIAGCGAATHAPKPETTVSGNAAPGTVNACLEANGYDIAGIDANHAPPAQDPHELALQTTMTAAPGLTNGYVVHGGGAGQGEAAIWYFDSPKTATDAASQVGDDAAADNLTINAPASVNVAFVAYSDPEQLTRDITACIAQALG